MGLVNMKELLEEASANKYAVGTFILVNIEFLEAILAAAIEVKSPVIVGVAQVHFYFLDMETLAPAIFKVAKEAPIPVAVHLDHASSIGAIMKAIKCGFTSVMFDGSALPFEENVAKTAEIVKFAHAVGVSVEGELGGVLGSESGVELGPPVEAPEELFTEPEQAAEFVERSGVDALAVAVGSVHGRFKGKPKIDFVRLKEIAELTKIPLVLHGGSGIAPEDYRRAIELGIRKVNVWYDLQRAALERIKERIKSDSEIGFPALMVACREGVKEEVKRYIGYFGSARVCAHANPLCRNCAACPKGRAKIQQEELVKLITEATLEALRNKRAP